MTKLRLISILCIGLVLINLTLLWFFVFHMSKNSKGEGPKKIVIEKLGFDKIQIKEYEKLIDWHRAEIKKNEAALFELKGKLYSTLLTNDSLSSKDTLIAQIGRSQIEMEQIHYKHFRDIKNLCKPNQLAKYEALTLEITHLFPRTRPK